MKTLKRKGKPVAKASTVVKKHVLRKNIVHKPAHDVGKCTTCGYHMAWLHGGDCPLCRACARCGSRVRHCVCLEGE